MSGDWEMHGPFETTITVWVTDGNNSAKVSWGKNGTMVGTEGYQEAINDALKAVRESQGERWRLMTKREFFDDVVSEKLGGAGMRFALPGGREWSLSGLDLSDATT